ncbi:MAG TPA: carbohydrate kinase family protein, partial [Rhodocyclaceae bacterium]|nr:carbohydrate kinase family protein [Rhodocyclaceae bacterium]
QPYAYRLEKLGIAKTHIREVKDTYTAQAFITTDLDDNQITAFHPGAMSHSDANKIADAADISLGIVAPDGRAGMLSHARQFHDAGIPFVFDPGQGLPMFDGDELLNFLKLADYCTVNDYEAKLLCERTARSLDELAREVKALVVTLGGRGSEIYCDGGRIAIPCVAVEEVVDPTGCGDAYRAGLLYGIARGWPWLKTGRLASLMGAVKIGHRGGQNHKPSRAEIAARFESAFGESI